MLTGCVVGFVCELNSRSGVSPGFCEVCASVIGSLGYEAKQAFKDLANGDLRREIAGCRSCLRFRLATYVFTASLGGWVSRP